MNSYHEPSNHTAHARFRVGVPISVVLLFLLLISTISSGGLPSSAGAMSLQQASCAGNLLQNPGFENETVGWSTIDGTINAVGQFAVEGNENLRLRPNTEGTIAFVYQDVANIPSDTVLDLSFAGGTDKAVDFDHDVYIEFYDASNNLIGASPTVDVEFDVDDAPPLLESYSLQATTPAGTSSIRMVGTADGDELALDDICLVANGTTTVPPTPTPDPNLQSVTLVKDDTTDSGTPFTIYSLTTTAYILSDDGTGTSNTNFRQLDPNRIYGFNELPKSGWELTDINCVDLQDSVISSVITYSDLGFTIQIAPGEKLTCTFTNTPNPAFIGGSISILKDAGGAVDNFDFESPWGTLTLDDGAGIDDTDGVINLFTTGNTLSAGSYTITETVPSGWLLKKIKCLDGTNTTYAFGDDAIFDVGETSVVIDLAAEENVACKFINEVDNSGTDGSITIDKEVTSTTTETFAFSGIAGIPALGDGDSHTISSVSPGTYNITEVFDGSQWILLDIDCGGATVTYSPGSSPTFEAETHTGVNITVNPSEDIACSFTNVPHDHGGITVQKVCAGGSTTDAFSFTDSSGIAGNFDLNCGGQTTIDGLHESTHTFTEVNLPTGWQFDSIACTDDADGSPVPASKLTFSGSGVTVDLSAGEDFTCTFTNSPTGPSTPLGDVNCSGTVDAVDALFILRYVVGFLNDTGSCPLNTPTTEINASVGDINGSGNTDAVDALNLLRCVVGFTDPVCSALDLNAINAADNSAQNYRLYIPLIEE